MSSSHDNDPLHQFKYAEFTDKKKLGEGEFGVVYQMRHEQFPKLAVREISRRYHARGGEQRALKQEAEKLLQIVSEHVIRLLGYVMEPDHLCLVFEYAEYGPLDKMLVRHEVHVPLKIRIAYEISMGMCFLHDKGVLHLRLKCHNVLICGSIHAKISDVCFTRNREMNTWTKFADVYRQSSRHTRPQSLGSSIAHVPPELIRDVNASPGKATDVYAYGIVAWQILTNKAPYEGETAENVCNLTIAGGHPDILSMPEDKPAVLYNIMLRCWKEKGERPSFREICTEMKPKFDEFEPEARNCARDCQKDLEDFCFPQSREFGAPEGDIRAVQVRRPMSRADGPAVPVSSVDKKLASARTVSEQQQGPTASHASEGIVERNYSTENKSGNMDETHPAEISARIATCNDLYQVAEELGSRWRQFGRHLGFSDGQLDNIEMTYNRNGFPEIPYQMLHQWKCHEGPITVGYLATQLKSNGKFYIVQKLAP